MAYIGNTLRTAQPNYQIIDDISASFDGSTTSFALQVGGATPAPFPVSAQHCLISVGGVVQQPDPTGTDGFLLSGSNIVFSAAPSAGENFFGVVLAGADYINVGAEFPDGSVANPSITFDSDRDTGLYRKGANNIAITTNGTERVSVGTSEVVFNDGGEDIDFRIEGDTASNLLFVDAGNDAVSFRDDVTIDSSGRLLVGTSSSSVNASMVLEGDSGSATGASQIYLQRGQTAGFIGEGDPLGVINFADNTGGRFARIEAEVDGAESGSDYPGRLVFSTTADGASSPTEGMRIDRDGKVHIGDDLGDRQAELFQVIRNGGGQGTNDCLVYFETTQNDWILNLNHTEFASGNAYFIDCTQRGTQRGKAWFDGSNMNWATSSDYRLKENVTPVTNGISEVKRLNPVNYNFIENPTVPQVGFLAHELDEVCPYAVGGEKDAVNEDGSIDPQMVDKSHVVPLLTAALKEAIAKIETLEAKVAALEAN